jgi:hypothetical protein
LTLVVGYVGRVVRPDDCTECSTIEEHEVHMHDWRRCPSPDCHSAEDHARYINAGCAVLCRVMAEYLDIHSVTFTPATVEHGEVVPEVVDFGDALKLLRPRAEAAGMDVGELIMATMDIAEVERPLFGDWRGA